MPAPKQPSKDPEKYIVFSEQLDFSGASAEAPKKVRLLKEGKYFYGMEPLDVSHEVLQNMVKNFKSGKKPEKPTKLCINYNHGIGYAIAPEDGVAAGWIEDVSLSDDGWLEIEASWTPRAQKYIEDKEYQYLSAEFYMDYKSKHNQKSLGPTLTGAAVTNIPFIEGQPGLCLSERPQEEEVMPELQEQLDELQVKFTDLETVKNALETEKTNLSTQLAEARNTVTTLNEKIAALEGEKTALAEGKATAEARIVELSNTIRASEADAYITAKLSEGYLTPAEKDEWKAAYLENKDMTIRLMERRPKVVEMKEIGKTEDPSEKEFDFTAEVEKYITEHKGTSYNDASIAVTKAHYNGGK